MHRGRNVLHFLRADIGELHRQLVGNLFMHRARNADAADLGETFETRRDIDAIAEQVAIALHHVADRDADAKAHLAARGVRHIPGAQAFLDIDRASHRFDSTWKFGKNGVAGGIEDAAAVSGDEVVGHLSIGGEAPQRFLFVLGNQPAVAGNIGRKNRRDLALHKAGPGQRSNAAECRRTSLGATGFQRPSRWAAVLFSSGCLTRHAALMHRRGRELVLDALEMIEPLDGAIEF